MARKFKKMTRVKVKKTAATYDYTLYTDGGCIFNPGGPGGCAAVLLDKTKNVREFYQGYQATTNNRMEIMAVILGLKRVPIGSSVLIYSDSQYVVNTMNGKFSKKKNYDLWKKLEEDSKDKNLDVRWVRGHNGNHYNERCDQLCSIAMQGLKLSKDTGYQDKTTSRKTGAMGVVFTLPKEYKDEEMVPLSPKEYCEIYHVNMECGKALAAFCQKPNHTFEDYLNLKTGGLDAYSRISKDSILNQTELSPEALNTIKQVLPTMHGQMCCLRWYMRGLPLADCIRKALVNQEVQENKKKK